VRSGRNIVSKSGMALKALRGNGVGYPTPQLTVEFGERRLM